MKIWNLKSTDPGSFNISADARVTPTDYINDQIWSLHLETSEPPSLALRTTFGLRARSLRLFPRFVEGDSAINDPAGFNVQPIVKRFYPNYLWVTFAPFMGIDVSIEYWVPDSQSVVGQVKITNSRLSARQIRFEWAALLRPSENGQPMAANKINDVTVLSGITDGITPVLFMTGGPEISAGPYPALSIDLDLSPGGTRQFTWAHAGLSDIESSFALAKKHIGRNWETELATVDVLNGRSLEIETGNREWDAVFALAQKSALGAFVGPTTHLPKPSFVSSRTPDQGFSPRGDGSDYTHLWSGQSVLETDYIIGLLLPNELALAKGLLENFLSTQNQKGFIDWKPGLAGQRGRMLATPLIVNMAWRIYEYSEDKNFLENIFPNLISYIQSWFTSEQDRDGDGIPEWDHPVQSGDEEHPVFSQWSAWAQGVDITQVESPSLCAFLYREIQLLIKIAQIVGQSSPVTALSSLADNLKSAVEASWNDKNKIYQHWDRETHLSTTGEFLGSRRGSGELFLEREFDHPVRLIIQVQSVDDLPRPVNIYIHGTSSSERHLVENIPNEQFSWYMGRGNVTSKRVYQALEHIQISGLEPDDNVTLKIIDLTVLDQTLLLPLWAEIPSSERADQLVQQTIKDEDKFWHPFGIPSFVHLFDEEGSAGHNVSMIWNSLIGEGLLRYGYPDEAATLFSRLMEAISQNLKKNHAFYQTINSKTGKGAGERDTLAGLPPIGLFLKILGVKIHSSRRVTLQGHNPFPMTITVKYRGLTIQREQQQTKLSFPGGQTAIVRNPKPRTISIEE